MTTWFITGTSSGFGRILTGQLLARGDRVAATLRRPEALDDLRAGAADRLWTAALDVTRPDAVGRVVDEAFAHFGVIDMIVNNAGYGLFAAVEEPSREQIARVIDTNLTGSIDVIRAALPHLRRQGHGRILQVSSAGGQTTYPGFGFYHAAKWGIEGFCETLAKEVAPFGIGVTIVEPGATPTGFGAGLDQAPPMPEYEAGPVGAVRRALNGGTFPLANDPAGIVAAMVPVPTSSRRPCACRSAATPTATCAPPTSSGSPSSTPRRTSRCRSSSRPGPRRPRPPGDARTSPITRVPPGEPVGP